MRLLYFSPIILCVAFLTGFLQRESAHQTMLASAYAAAQGSAAAGDLVSAKDGFSALTGFRDADQRAQEINVLLRPLEAGYAEGTRAINQGDYERAVELLAPVAAQAPALRDVTARLDDARQLFAQQLHDDVGAAELVHDWPEAEQLLRAMVALEPGDDSIRSRLASLQRDQGPIILGQGRELWLASPEGNKERQLTDALQVIWPTWSPDRSHIAFLAPDADDPSGNVSLYIAAVAIDSAEPRRLASGVSAHTAPSWSPDGTKIAYTSFAGYDPLTEIGSVGVRTVEIASGQETDLTGARFALAFNPSWSPQGDELAFVVKDQGISERPQHSSGDVYVVSIGTSDFENLTAGAVRDVWSVAWSPRGDALLLFSVFGQTWYEPPSTSIRLLDLQSETLTVTAQVDEHPTSPMWSPDGSRFAFTVDEKEIVVVPPGGERQTVAASTALSGEMTWSPDGEKLLLAPWNADESSTILDFSGPEASLRSVRIEFDASPPFISPPQWAPAVAIPPEENPSLLADPEPALAS